MEPGASVQVQNDGSSASWSFNYSYVDAGSGSGTGDRPSAASIAVDVTTTAGGPGALTVTTRSSGTSAIGFRTVQVDRTELGIITITSSTSFARVQYANGNPTTDAARGPAWVSGDSGLGLTAAQVEALPQRAAGENVVGSGMNGSSLVFSGTGRATRGASTPDTHDISFQNNTGSDIILDSDSTGGARTITNGANVQVQNDGSSNSWRYDYRFAPSTQPANTAIPESGEVSLDEYNTPGNAAP